MEMHCIISEGTLLSEGLQHFLESQRNAHVVLITPEEIQKGGGELLTEPHYVWIDTIREPKEMHKLCQKILTNQSELKILVFGESKDSQSIQCIVRAGASGYLLSNCCTQILNDAIQKVSSGNFFVDPLLKEIFVEALLQSHHTPSVKSNLTRRERQILQLIVDEYTTHEIANKLYISFCTVETHRLHLIQKMGVKNTAGLVREAIANNLLLGYP
jgi:DNA-binding NarL/FixJ family response regulator